MFEYLARIGDGSERHRDGREDENNRQNEEPSPTGRVYEDSRHEHPQDASAAGDATPYTDRLGTLFCRKGRGNDREGDGHDHRRADAAEKSRSEHDPGGSGQTRRSACYAKDDQARDQDCFAAPAIADRAERQQQRGHRDGVDVDHPQDAALRCVKGESELRLSDVQRGDRCDDCHKCNAHPNQDGETPAGGVDRWVDCRDLCRRNCRHDFLGKM